MNFNEGQKQAVETSNRKVMVSAGAGCGKTRVLTARIAWLIADGAIPATIVALSFTQKAAQEMKERVMATLEIESEHTDSEFSVMPFIGTFHALCVQILRAEVGNFSILSGIEQQALIKKLMDAVSFTGQYSQKDLADFLARKKSGAGEIYEGILEKDKIAFDQLYGRYQTLLAEKGMFDFDDLLHRVIEIFEKQPDVLDRYRTLYEHILVDEFQDVNKSQVRLLELLIGKDLGPTLFVIGDADQTIYSWRGAEVGNMTKFEEIFGEHELVLLEQNYRNPGLVLKAAETVIGNNKERISKKLWTERKSELPITAWSVHDEFQEAQTIVHEIERRIGGTSHQVMNSEIVDSRDEQQVVGFDDIVILYRTGSQNRVLSEALGKAGIPYRVVGGKSFFEYKLIKGLLDYLRVMNGRDDEALKKIINVPTRGIGAKAIEALEKTAREWEVGLEEVLARSGQILGLAEKTKRSLGAFLELVNGLRLSAEMVNLSYLIKEIYDRAGFAKTFASEGDEKRFLKLLTLASQFDYGSGAEGMEELLESVDLRTEADRVDVTGHAVTLMSLHAAKGLEFPIVFLAGCEEGLLPHEKCLKEQYWLEEERRLFYVGMTRAQQELILTWSQSRNFGDENSSRTISRFVKEIPEDCIEFKAARTPRKKKQKSGVKQETMF